MPRRAAIAAQSGTSGRAVIAPRLDGEALRKSAGRGVTMHDPRRRNCRRRCRGGRRRARAARVRPTCAVGDDRELVEQVDRLLGPAHEVAGGEVGIAQHVVERAAARPAVHREARARSPAAGCRAACARARGRRARSTGRSCGRTPRGTCRAAGCARRRRPRRGAARRRASWPWRRATGRRGRPRSRGAATRRRAGRARRRCAAASCPALRAELAGLAEPPPIGTR